MNISLDYDFTYTLDPDFWDEVVKIGRQRGHSFVCITNRERPPEVDEPIPNMKIYCSPDIPKGLTSARYKLGIDVWIDDSPSTIE